MKIFSVQNHELSRLRYKPSTTAISNIVKIDIDIFFVQNGAPRCTQSRVESIGVPLRYKPSMNLIHNNVKNNIDTFSVQNHELNALLYKPTTEDSYNGMINELKVEV